MSAPEPYRPRPDHTDLEEALLDSQWEDFYEDLLDEEEAANMPPVQLSQPPPAQPAPAQPAVPSLADMVRDYVPIPRGASGGGLTAAEIASYVAIGVLRILISESNDPAGGFDFDSALIRLAVPELVKAFDSANTPGNYANGGLVVHGEIVETGLNLPLTSKSGANRFAPVVESKTPALAKLHDHGWTEGAIVAELGEPSWAALHSKLNRLWPLADYRAHYPRGRKRTSPKPKR